MVFAVFDTRSGIMRLACAVITAISSSVNAGSLSAFNSAAHCSFLLIHSLLLLMNKSISRDVIRSGAPTVTRPSRVTSIDTVRLRDLITW